jgi:hypothetical protein
MFLGISGDAASTFAIIAFNPSRIWRDKSSISASRAAAKSRALLPASFVSFMLIKTCKETSVTVERQEPCSRDSSLLARINLHRIDTKSQPTGQFVAAC